MRYWALRNRHGARWENSTALNRVKRRYFVNMVINLWVPKDLGKSGQINKFQLFKTGYAVRLVHISTASRCWSKWLCLASVPVNVNWKRKTSKLEISEHSCNQSWTVTGLDWTWDGVVNIHTAFFSCSLSVNPRTPQPVWLVIEYVCLHPHNIQLVFKKRIGFPEACTRL